MISDGLYYEIAALPMLSLGETPLISVDEFTAFCEARLPEKLSSALKKVSLEPHGKACCRAGKAWECWETAIRNGIAKVRAELLGVDVVRWLRYEEDVFPSDVARLQGILELEDPLARQEALDALRWRELDSLTVGHEFDFDALVVYKLKLLLACRWTEMADRDVESCFNRLVEGGVKQALDCRETVEPGTVV